MASLKDVNIFKENGRIKAELRFTVGKELLSIRYLKKMNRSIKRRHYDNGDVGVIIPVFYIYDFIEMNKTTCGEYDDVIFNQDSLPQFYGYYLGEHIVTNDKLTRAFLEEWANYDCPELIRYTVNKDRHANDFGLNLMFFENPLYCSTYLQTTVDDTITEDEYKAFEKAIKGTWAYEQIKEAYEIDHSDIDCSVILKEVEAYEAEIQEQINLHAEELKAYADELPERHFDCGFSKIYTYNTEITKKLRILERKNLRTTETINVKFPFEYFSVTNSKMIFDFFKLKLAANNEICNQLHVKTILD